MIVMSFVDCALCGLFCDPNERLPWDEGRVAHLACALHFSVETGLRTQADPFLEGSDSADNIVRTDECMHASTHMYVEDLMPRPSQRSVEIQRKAGYISALEAEQITGINSNTFYNWIRAKENPLVARRVGHFWWISIASLAERCPQLADKLPQAAAGGAA